MRGVSDADKSRQSRYAIGLREASDSSIEIEASNLLENDGVDLQFTVHIRAKDNPSAIGGEVGVWFKLVIVMAEVGEARRLEFIALGSGETDPLSVGGMGNTRATASIAAKVGLVGQVSIELATTDVADFPAWDLEMRTSVLSVTACDFSPTGDGGSGELHWTPVGISISSSAPSSHAGEMIESSEGPQRRNGQQRTSLMIEGGSVLWNDPRFADWRLFAHVITQDHVPFADV